MQFTLCRLLGFRIRRASLNVFIVSRHNIFLLLFFNKSLCCHPVVRLSSQHIADFVDMRLRGDVKECDLTHVFNSGLLKKLSCNKRSWIIFFFWD